jgi:succinate dehydrogenase / fumarate reductase cytochrome b subunit
MVMSIVHRATGAALYIGFIALVIWLAALAAGPESYSLIRRMLRSPFGLAILFAFTWALLHHVFGGIRHLIWDLSIAHTYPSREYLTQATLIASMVCAAGFWIALYWVGGNW